MFLKTSAMKSGKIVLKTTSEYKIYYAKILKNFFLSY